jgi:hypothetical protein
MKITSMACAYDTLFVGGFKGECIWKKLQGDDTVSTSRDHSTTGITNYTDIVQDRMGRTLAIVSNNDGVIKSINLETAQIMQKFTLPFAGNVSLFA